MGEFTPMQPIIREYRTDDLDAVVRLSLDAWAPVFASIREVQGSELFERLHGDDWRQYQRQSVEHVLRDASMHVWLAEDDGDVVGFVAVVVHPDRRMGEIVMIAVAAEHQTHGIGTELTTVATDWIRQAGVPIAMIETGGDPGHAPARALYEKAGYSPTQVVRYFKAL